MESSSSRRGRRGSRPITAVSRCRSSGARISSRGAPLTVCVGETLELGFDRWECATNAEVTQFATWATSEPAIALVDRGAVRGVAAGSAKITATYGERSDVVTVTVATCGGGR